MLLPSIAKKIIQEVRRLIHEEIILVDTSGTIIASTDEKRIGTFHEGALISSREYKKLIITEEMQSTLQGVKAGINLPILFQNKVIGVIGITGNPEEISSYGELLKKMTELLVQENYFSDQMEWSSRALEAFILDWLQLNEFTAEFKQRAELLTIDLNVRRQVIIGELWTASTIIGRDVWNELHYRFPEHDHTVYGRWGNNRFVLLSTGQSKKEITHFLHGLKNRLKEDFAVSVSFGIGNTVEALELRKSFHQAERALRVAKQTNAITFDNDLKMEMLLQEINVEVKQDYLVRTIGSLLEEKELLETLQVFIAQNQAVKASAELLHIHVNTLHYRLGKIEELTGLAPRSFTNLVTLYLALLLLEEPPKV